MLALAEDDTELSAAEKIELFRGVCNRLLSAMQSERTRAEQAERACAELETLFVAYRRAVQVAAQPFISVVQMCEREGEPPDRLFKVPLPWLRTLRDALADPLAAMQQATDSNADAVALLGRLGAAWVENAALRRWLRGELTIADADIDAALAAESALATHDAGAALLAELEAARAFIGWPSKPEGNIYEPLRIEERLATYQTAVKAAKG